MSLRVNPEYEKLLPQMAPEEFAQLKLSIQEEGQHYPIVANEDLEVLDGHNRFKACVELGIEPDFEVRKFDDKLIEKKFVIEANLRRRHLNNFQLVELGVPLLEIEKTLAERRQARGGKNGRKLQLGLDSGAAADDVKPILKTKVAEVVAKKVGVSTRTFERGKKILEEASEEEKQRLRVGKTSIAQVYREVVTSKREADKPLSDSGASVVAEYPTSAQNKVALEALLKDLIEKKLFCPSCGNYMFECSKCHKTLQDSLHH